jgi:hypothetical protein
MINQTIKSDLTSWQICLGMLPLPKRIIRDIDGGQKKQHTETFFKKIKLTRKQVKEIEDFSRENIKLTYSEIYDTLIELDMLPQSDNGRYPSLARISEIIANVRKDMGLNKGGRDTGKIAYEMHLNGATDDEISASLGVKKSSAICLRSKYKVKLRSGGNNNK